MEKDWKIWLQNLALMLKGYNVIELFTAVIYYHSMVIPPFYVMKIFYLGYYHGMALNCQGKKFFNIDQWWQTYQGSLPQNFNPGKCGYCIKLLVVFVAILKSPLKVLALPPSFN